MNSSIRRACNSAIFDDLAFRLRNRRLLEQGWQVRQNRNDPDSAAALFPIARDNSSRRLSMLTTGANFSRSGGLFSCLHTGQDSSGKKSDGFFVPVISVKIGVCADVFFRLNFCSRQALRLFGSLRHASNLAKDFEHDVQRNRASRTQIEPGAKGRE